MRYLARSAAVVLVLTAIGVVAPNAPATALSCIGPDYVIDEAESLFTGTVSEFDQDHARVEVAVNEVWRGKQVPALVRLHDDLPYWSHWKPGHQYLFAPRTTAGGYLAVSTCSAWSNPMGFLEHRPQTVHETAAAVPELVPAKADASRSIWFLIGGALGATGLVVAFALALRGRPR